MNWSLERSIRLPRLYPPPKYQEFETVLPQRTYNMTTCYKCGDEGHYAYECPDQGGEIKSGTIFEVSVLSLSTDYNC